MDATASLLADTICRTVELGVTITDAAVDGEFTHLFCAPVAVDPACPGCVRVHRPVARSRRAEGDRSADHRAPHPAARAGTPLHLR